MIRAAQASDADAIAVLEEEAFGIGAWSPAQVEEELGGDTRHVVVAEANDIVAGYGAIAVAGDVADLTRIVVAQAHRRSGLAASLLTALHEAARRAGAQRIMLEVAESNEDALAFYRVRGYSEVARRRAYYADGDDALVLERRLDGILEE
jgi:ribosomal-protein-alanine N-acetyltransferase